MLGVVGCVGAALEDLQGIIAVGWDLARLAAAVLVLVLLWRRVRRGGKIERRRG